MLTKTLSAALSGIDALPVDIEVNATGQGEQSIVSIVGLPDAAVKESRERVRSALRACGYVHPAGSTLVNLAPADIKKEGAGFDLPIALGMIAATGAIPRESLASFLAVGELALDGTVRPAKGILPIAMLARESGKVSAMIVPAENVTEAAIVIFQYMESGASQRPPPPFQGALKYSERRQVKPYSQSQTGREFLTLPMSRGRPWRSEPSKYRRQEAIIP